MKRAWNGLRLAPADGRWMIDAVVKLEPVMGVLPRSPDRSILRIGADGQCLSECSWLWVAVRREAPAWLRTGSAQLGSGPRADMRELLGTSLRRAEPIRRVSRGGQVAEVRLVTTPTAAGQAGSALWDGGMLPCGLNQTPVPAKDPASPSRPVARPRDCWLRNAQTRRRPARFWRA